MYPFSSKVTQIIDFYFSSEEKFATKLINPTNQQQNKTV